MTVGYNDKYTDWQTLPNSKYTKYKVEGSDVYIKHDTAAVFRLPIRTLALLANDEDIDREVYLRNMAAVRGVDNWTQQKYNGAIAFVIAIRNGTVQFPEEFVTSTQETRQAIVDVCFGLKDFLLEKNEHYGDSALDPVRIFSNADPGEQILVRLDDKLSRIRNSDGLRRNDVVDLAGYLVLLMVQHEWTDMSDLID